MKVIQTDFEGLRPSEPDIFSDGRVYFFEFKHVEKFKSAGIPINFCQDNQSYSEKGVLQGLHFQKNLVSKENLYG